MGFWSKIKIEVIMNYKQYIREVENHPVDGVNFKDISPLLSDEQMFSSAVEKMGEFFNILPDYWVGAEARGFIFASALATRFGGGVVMCRKQGKLPPPVESYGYNTEYSSDILEMKSGRGTAVVVDDVLATGGTIQVVNDLTKISGYDIIGNVVLIDLKYVPRVDWLEGLTINSVVEYG